LATPPHQQKNAFLLLKSAGRVESANLMAKLVTAVKASCWLIVMVFVAASVTLGVYAWTVIPGLWCGNVVADPLSFLLNFAAPATGCAVLAFGVLSFRDRAGIWSPIAAGTLWSVVLAALLAFGFWFFEKLPVSLSEVIWWLRLFGAH
jgi:hypothetical protein